MTKIELARKEFCGVFSSAQAGECRSSFIPGTKTVDCNTEIGTLTLSRGTHITTCFAGGGWEKTDSGNILVLEVVNRKCTLKYSHPFGGL